MTVFCSFCSIFRDNFLWVTLGVKRGKENAKSFEGNLSITKNQLKYKRNVYYLFHKDIILFSSHYSYFFSVLCFYFSTTLNQITKHHSKSYTHTPTPTPPHKKNLIKSIHKYFKKYINIISSTYYSDDKNKKTKQKKKQKQKQKQKQNVCDNHPF